MPAITTAICGVPLTISAPTQNLIDLFADYFRYYQLRSADDLPAAAATPVNQPLPALKLEFKLKNALPPREQLIPPTAKLFSQTGQVSLWRETRRAGDALAVERFYFHLGTAFFHVEPHLGRAVGTVTPRALEQPQILANTYTLFALLLMLRARGLYHLHAAAVVTPRDKLCLICGPQHAGKSTLATALGLAGWRPISDDSLIIGAHAGQASLTAFKKHFHLANQLLAAWPALADLKRRHQYLDRSCVAGLEFFDTVALADAGFHRIDYLVLPEITATPTSRLVPLPHSEALLKLAEQSMYFQLWSDHTMRQWELLLQLARSAACYQLIAGADVLSDPQRTGAEIGRGIERPSTALSR